MMFSRVTLFEVDALRVNINKALEDFKRLIVPNMQQQAGYRGSYLMLTPEGKGLLMTLWETREDAEAGIYSGYYQEQLGKMVSLFRSPPGREQYQVVFEDLKDSAPASTQTRPS
jgi:hypothetical protein